MRKGLFAAYMVAAICAASVATPSAAQLYTRETSSQSDALPADFRGRITYQGTHEGVLERGPRRGSRQYGGALTIELTFDGNSVKGRFSGTGGINSGTMSGTRNGSHCRLFEDGGSDIIEGECTRSRFFATARSQGGRNAMAAQFVATATKFVDLKLEEDRSRAAAQAAERPREIAASPPVKTGARPGTLSQALEGRLSYKETSDIIGNLKQSDITQKKVIAKVFGFNAIIDMTNIDIDDDDYYYVEAHYNFQNLNWELLKKNFLSAYPKSVCSRPIKSSFAEDCSSSLSNDNIVRISLKLNKKEMVGYVSLAEPD